MAAVNICLLCGLPGSGKSTWLKGLTQRCSVEKTFSSTLIQSSIVIPVEYDVLLPGYSRSVDENNTSSWKDDRWQILRLTEALIQHFQLHGWTNLSLVTPPKGIRTQIWQQFSTVLQLDIPVTKDVHHILFVIDDNMYFRSMRYQYFQLARQYCTGFCQIYLKCPLGKAIARNRQRQAVQQVPEEVITRMSKKLEPPDVRKYRWEKNSITLDCESETSYLGILPVIEEAFAHPVQPAEETDEEEQTKSRLECSASVLHQADLILRKCVASLMAQYKVCKCHGELKSLSKEVLSIKEKILRDLKSGHISLTLSSSDIQNAAQDPSCEFYHAIKDLFQSQIS